MFEILQTIHLFVLSASADYSCDSAARRWSLSGEYVCLCVPVKLPGFRLVPHTQTHTSKIGNSWGPSLLKNLLRSVGALKHDGGSVLSWLKMLQSSHLPIQPSQTEMQVEALTQRQARVKTRQGVGKGRPFGPFLLLLSNIHTDTLLSSNY